MVDIASPGKDGTGETYDLDNVTLTEGAPTPSRRTPPQNKKKCKKKKAGGGREEEVQEEAGRERTQRLTRGASIAPSRQRS